MELQELGFIESLLDTAHLTQYFIYIISEGSKIMSSVLDRQRLKYLLRPLSRNVQQSIVIISLGYRKEIKMQ